MNLCGWEAASFAATHVVEVDNEVLGLEDVNWSVGKSCEVKEVVNKIEDVKGIK